MKTKTICLLISICLLQAFNQLEAQNRKRNLMPVRYSLNPISPLPLSVKTYSIHIDTDFLLSEDINDMAERIIGIYPLNKVESNGDLLIKITAKEFKESRDFNGKVITDKYGMRCDYTCNLEVINNLDGKKILEKDLSGSDEERTIIIIDPLLKMRLVNGNEDAIKLVLKNNRPDLLKSTFQNIGYLLKHQYTKITRVDSLYCYTAKGKSDYTEIENAFNITKEAIYSLCSKKPDEVKIKSNFTLAISIWEKELLSADYNNEDARINTKIADALKFNIAFVSMWLNDFEKANIYVSQLISAPVEDKINFSSDFEMNAKALKDMIKDFSLRN